MKTREYRIGDVMELVRRPVTVDPAKTYTEIGIRSFGKGIFHKPPISGAELGNKRVFEIHPGELIFNTVFAWEGAVAVSGEEETGTIGSHRFMTYQVDPDIADVRYLYYFFHSEAGLPAVRAASPGSAGRNKTLGIKLFAEQKISLPSIEEQRRVAAKLDRAFSSLERIPSARRDVNAESTLDALEEKLVCDLVYSGWKWRRLSEVAEINPRRRPVRDEEKVLFVPMAAVDALSGKIVSSATRSAYEVTKGYTQFRRGDVIFARITPCMQNGKSAIVETPPGVEFGYGSTEFHVIRPSGLPSARWIHFWIRRAEFRRQAMTSFTGTAGQQRVPASFLQSAQVLVAPSKDAEDEALARADALNNMRAKLRSAQARSLELRKALGPSLLNAAFTGQL
ncbi:Type I restriction-modification system [Carbonactinospora thermoautotrophica]|uniref:Type I restriction-modification system n=1 Tax=Carbonactinospora thermoautotrophica TaxID=1469144 RepID=A0A132ML64_9ACTN|nr:restriction endonuclease subunit S [Carbonactinospora thermoautotrophica]KWW98566.1 Type I restriction-modification system [Carbonactinospora thermoautotrophica]